MYLGDSLIVLGIGSILLVWFAIYRGRDVSFRIGGPKVGIHLETRPSSPPTSESQLPVIVPENAPLQVELEKPQQPQQRLLEGTD